LRAAFLSNSFAAFRVAVLRDVGGFPRTVPLGEDMVVAARMLTRGYRIAYVSTARVLHSHDFSHLQECLRYYYTGGLHAQQPWLLRAFSAPEGEGLKFLLSEAGYVRKHAPARLPEVLSRAVARYLGYRVGRLRGRAARGAPQGQRD
jgi:rhamnosyltransferase